MTEFLASKLDNETNYITWRTTSEKNVRWFHLERAVDGINFNEIAKVIPASAMGAFYEHKDKLPDAKTSYYYRIANENLDGSMEYSGIRVVERNSNSVPAIRNVYPNPFSNDLNFDVQTETETSAIIEVYGMFGRKVYCQQRTLKEGVNTINVTDFNEEKGLYVVRVVDLSGREIFTRKMIRQ
jgi:hypothetical protein